MILFGFGSAELGRAWLRREVVPDMRDGAALCGYLSARGRSMFWLMRRAALLWVGTLALLAEGMWRTAIGIHQHAAGMMAIGLALLAIAGLLIWRALRPAVTATDEQVNHE
jgi:hypothetical protein